MDSNNNNKRPVGDDSDNETKEVKKVKVKKPTAAQQAKQARIEQEKKEREERWERNRQANDIVRSIGVDHWLQNVHTCWPDPITSAIAALPETAREYVRFANRNACVQADWNFHENKWEMRPASVDNKMLYDVVQAYINDAPGLRENVTKIQELETAAEEHVRHVLHGDLLELYGPVERFCSKKALFDFVVEKLPQLKGTPDKPLSIENYDTNDMLKVARRALANDHKHHVVTEPVPLPPVLQEAVDKHKAAQAEAKAKGKGKGRR